MAESNKDDLRIKAGPLELNTTGKDLSIMILIIVLGCLGGYAYHILATQHTGQLSFLMKIAEINATGVCVNALSSEQKQDWLRRGGWCGYANDEIQKAIRPEAKQ